MTRKKKKFATTFLSTTLFTCGFSLEPDAVPQIEEQHPTGFSATSKETKTQDLAQTRHKTGQPSPENVPTFLCKLPREQPSPLPEEPNTAKQDTQTPEDILQKILNNTYDFNGDEVIYTETAIIYITFPTAEERQPVYVNGFGWVEPSNEPNTQILALDMYESGVKVGSMGGS